MKIFTLLMCIFLFSEITSAQNSVDSITTELKKKITADRFSFVKITPKKNFKCRKTKLFAASNDWTSTLVRKIKIFKSGVKFEKVKYKDLQNKITALFVNDTIMKFRWAKVFPNKRTETIVYVRNLYFKSLSN